MANVFESEQPSAVDDAPDVGSITLPASSSNSRAELSLLSLGERFALVRSVGEECIQEDVLRNLLQKKPNPICYDRFEPYGRKRIAQADICQLGIDRRKVNMLAREYCDDIKRKNKPIILSHHILPGLQQGQEKMSKSDPSSIYMEDEEDYACMDELIFDYESGALHPVDVKLALSKALNEILQLVRDHFKNNKEARELLETVKAYRVSR